MKLKYYVTFSAIFMLIIGVYAYELESSSYTYHIPFSQMNITLPVAIWIILILALFFACQQALAWIWRAAWKRSSGRGDV